MKYFKNRVIVTPFLESIFFTTNSLEISIDKTRNIQNDPCFDSFRSGVAFSQLLLLAIDVFSQLLHSSGDFDEVLTNKLTTN